jgi:hypothetical protein
MACGHWMGIMLIVGAVLGFVSGAVLMMGEGR